MVTGAPEEKKEEGPCQGGRDLGTVVQRHKRSRAGGAEDAAGCRLRPRAVQGHCLVSGWRRLCLTDAVGCGEARGDSQPQLGDQGSVHIGQRRSGSRGSKRL